LGRGEHPRYVSDALKIGENEERVFEISYHYVERKYYVETYETVSEKHMEAGSSSTL
jgi:hypothetical protein